MDILSVFGTLTTLVGGVTLLAELVDKLWHLDGWFAQARSLVLALILGLAGAGLQIGMFADPVVMGTLAWYFAGPIIGLAAGLIANWSFTTPIVLKVLELIKLRPKVVILVMLLALPGLAGAQTFDNFWHPAPMITGSASQPRTLAKATAVGLGGVIWEFKPTVQVSATSIRAGATGADPMLVTFLSAAGPALTLQKTVQDANGVNYAQYSGSLAFLVTGRTDEGPTFQPAVALTVGFLNNIVQLGAGYELTAVNPSRQRIFGLLSIGVNLTNN